MSIAYGFEPDVSPIYEDDDDHPGSQHSVQFSSADTPKRSGRPSSSRHRKTLGVTQMFNESSLHHFHLECAPSDSEVVQDSTLNYVEPSDEVVPDSRDGLDEVEDEDEVVPDSTGFLADTFIVLSAGCCLPIRQHLTKCLVEMGAKVQPTVDHLTTHVVVDRYADESVVRSAMARTPSPPLMVDVKWIQECVDRREKCEETDYSMSDCRYLKQTCRRLSTFREPTPFDQEISIEWADMENEGPVEDPAVLLEQIRKLSERLDALMDYVPIIRFEYHSPDCPTRQRPANFVIPNTQLSPPNRRNPKNPQNPDHLRNVFQSISTSFPIRRRRSFTGFSLEHREPEHPVLQVHLENRDVRETWKEPGKLKKARRNAKNTKKPQKPVKMTQNPPKTVQKRPKLVPVRADDSDIQSALASLTISSPQRLPPNPEVSRISRTSNSVEILEIRRREPLIVTKSAFINRLQCADDSRDDDFISDVSAFRIRKNGERKATNRSNFQESRRNFELEAMGDTENPRNGVVFTGFGKDSSIEKKLKSIVRRFKLHLRSEIDSSTRCVVSRHGKRTLVVLKALCLEIPVVRPQWLEESFEDSQLLEPEDYAYPEWTTQNRKSIFSNFFGKFWISANCQPTRDDLAWMIGKCGGKITRRIANAEMIIAPENWEKEAEVEEELDGIHICTPLFVIDSISAARLQATDDYLID